MPVGGLGEYLLGGVYLGAMFQAPVGSSALFTLPLPNETALVGARLSTQAAVLGSTLTLCNALDLTFGL